MQDLVKRWNERCDAVPFDASWYLKDLAAGAAAAQLIGRMARLRYDELG